MLESGSGAGCVFSMLEACFRRTRARILSGARLCAGFDGQRVLPRAHPVGSSRVPTPYRELPQGNDRFISFSLVDHELPQGNGRLVLFFLSVKHPYFSVQ